jgi:Ca-activated chloride channel homolog
MSTRNVSTRIVSTRIVPILTALTITSGLFGGTAAAQGTAADGKTNVMFIFDASGSMKRAAGNESRMSVAKRTFGETLAAMPKEVQTGLLVFGHRRRNDCSDIEVVSPIGADSAVSQSQMVAGFEAIGETPIASAITRAGQSLRAFKGQQNSIVLVTDGIEECRGDPCAAAAGLKELGIDVKVHVVGFALGAGESSKLQCVVDQTGGKYFDAKDAAALKRTLAEVRQMVTQKPTPPPTPVVVVRVPESQRASKLIFEDKFDGKDLSGETWEVLNRNADRYIVEKGELLLVNPGAAGFHVKDATNIVRVKHELPDGDWDIVVDAKLQFQTGFDSFHVGLMTDDKNSLGISINYLAQSVCSKIELVATRASGGELTSAPRIFAGYGCGYGPATFEEVKSIAKALETNGVRMVLQKRDRKYSGTFEIKDWLDSSKKPRKITTDELTSLRTPGRISMQVGKLDPKRPSETGARIDQIQVLAYE